MLVSTKLAPGLLVASPSLLCPFFGRTVVVLVQHDDRGALGFVINKPTEMPIAQLFEGLELEASDEEASADEPGSRVWLGGPVSTEMGSVLFDPTSGDASDVESVTLSPGLALSASKALLARIAKGEGPRRFVVLLGYAGWSPDQLDDEIREGSWLWDDLDAELVFGGDPETRWKRAMERIGVDPARVASKVGQA